MRRLLGRTALYFDEVARQGSIRRASETLHIAASAIDRQIVELETDIGVALFERSPHGLRLTAAGEILVGAVRGWRRELQRALVQIDDLRGLRRGEVKIGLIEGVADFLASGIRGFGEKYPAIAYQLLINSAPRVLELLLAMEIDFALVFNPPSSPTLNVEKTAIYQIGAVVRTDSPLAARAEVSLAECASYPLILPDENLSLRRLINQAWARTIGGPVRGIAMANSVAGMKALIKAGRGIGVLTALDVFDETAQDKFRFIPFSESNLPLSVLSIVTLAGRTLSMPALLMIQHVAALMLEQDVPTV